MAQRAGARAPRGVHDGRTAPGRVVDVPQDDEDVEDRGAARGSGAGRKPRDSREDAGSRTSDAVAEPKRRRSSEGRTSGPTFDGAFDLLEGQAVDEEVETPIRDRQGRRQPARVLLVDDEDQLRRVMRDLLERDGYTVLEARDGVEALDQVDRHGPDIIVLDLNLPGLDGYGVLSHLRSRRGTEEIPVVVLTARGDEENEVRVFEFGADDFLSKPFRARALSARLDAVLRRTRRAPT